MSEYFANKTGEELGTALTTKIADFNNYLRTSGRQVLYRNVYNNFYQAERHLGNIYKSGEQGEFTEINVNLFRNAILHIKSMIQAQKITLTPSAMKTDSDILDKTILAKQVLSYYQEVVDVDAYMDKALDVAQMYADCYSLVEWDDMAGEAVVPDEQGRIAYEGDPKISIFPPYFVIIDPVLEHATWHMFKCKVNKYELAAQFPQHYDRIVNQTLTVTSEDNMDWVERDTLYNFSEDACWVYKFFHKRTRATPYGKMAVMLEDGTILEEDYLKGKRYCVSHLTPSKKHESPWGYANSFDALQLSRANNKVFSTILTNETKFGVQILMLPKGSDLEVSDVIDGAKVCYYNPEVGEPKGVNLLNTSAQTFAFGDLLNKSMDTMFAVTDVIKGQAPSGVESGSALALLQSMTVAYNSTLQRSFVRFLEETFTNMLDVLVHNVKGKRMFQIVGEDLSDMYSKSWEPQDLNDITNVRVQLGDPSQDTTIGRRETADHLIQYGEISTDQYFQIRETGQAGVAINSKVSHASLIKKENEMLTRGELPLVLKADKHIDHIKEHLCLMDRPEIRYNRNAVGFILRHVQEHEVMYKTLLMEDPAFLQMTGQPLLEMGMMAPQEEEAPLPNQQEPVANQEVQMSNLPEMPEMPQSPLEG